MVGGRGVSYLFHYGRQGSDHSFVIGFDSLTDKVHHFLTAQNVPVDNTI